MIHTKEQTLNLLRQLIRCPDDQLDDFSSQLIHDHAVWDIAHPINRLEGRQSILDHFIRPIKSAIKNVYRRDEIFIGGTNRRDYGGRWVSSVTHYVGNFQEDLFGVRAHNHLTFLRSGEFYRLEDGKVVEAKIIIDLLDLLRQTGRFPLEFSLGAELLFPSPATHDGVLPGAPERSEASLDLVERMLGDLKEYDPETFTSKGQTGSDGAWHDDMMWYGPAGIGSNFQWEGFEKDHRAAFLTAFPDRVGGDHYCRIGDGDYAAVSGWPSMTMTHKGDYLGIPATGLALTLRVMDFYRCNSDKIIENWVCLDYLDLFNQMGVDLIEKARQQEPER